MFSSATPIPPGILIFPESLSLSDSMLYVLVSDSADNAALSLRDRATGAQISLSLPAEHAAIAVISKKGRKLVATYGF
jgi:hypothetical protein